MAQIGGTKRHDVLSGTDFNDVIRAGAGDDTIFGSDGTDRIDGGTGSDTLNYAAYTGDLSIVLNGSHAVKVYANGATSDVISNIENLTGGRGDDYFAGDDNNNTFRGNAGNDYFLASNGFDHYYGGAGYDMVDYSNTGIGIVITVPVHGTAVMSAGANDYDTLNSIEQIIGSSFNDHIYGGAVDNELHGGAGNDTLSGGAGGDVLDGGTGNDRLTGGSDADIFVFSGDFGVDTVTDFHAKGDDHDVLDMRDVATVASFDTLLYGHRIWQSGHDVMIDAAKGNEIILRNVDIHDLAASDFLF